MRKLAAFLAPCVATLTLFLILFNNVENGQAILTLLIVLNICALVILAGCRQSRAVLAYARASSACLVTALTALLAIELSFPIFWPRDYAQIRDLTKQYINSRVAEPHGISLVFMNPDQQVSDADIVTPATAQQAREWHKPGGRFAYYGYDPNLRTAYLNLFRWNAEGYYDHDYPPGNEGDTFRIVIIGDSFVEAVQVPLFQSFHKLLENSLNETGLLGRTKRVQVIGLGNSGTGQVENCSVLRRQAVQYAPDVVMICLSSNDFCDDDPELKKELVLASGTITPFIRGLAGHGYFAMAFAVRRVQDLQRKRITISPDLLQWCRETIPRVEVAWARTLQHVLASRDFCKDRGIEFFLVYLGSDIEVKYMLDPKGTVTKIESMGGPHARMTWDLGRSLRRVRSFCHEHEIPLVSLLEPLSMAQENTGHQVFDDHYTMFGHQVAAHVLNCALASRFSEASGGPCMDQDFWRELPPVTVVAARAQPPQLVLVPAS
ncbi:MAG: hypothetical protein FJY85_10470, partial [Deltaproteobacteria bacterium]|nr:hypothetical protein [Deltaproteobacteria bacterium]